MGENSQSAGSCEIGAATVVLTPNEASSQPSRKMYGASLKRIIPQPPLPCKNNGLSHDQHSVRQQGGSDVCGEIVVTKESSLHSPYSAFCLT